MTEEELAEIAFLELEGELDETEQLAEQQYLAQLEGRSIAEV